MRGSVAWSNILLPRRDPAVNFQRVTLFCTLGDRKQGCVSHYATMIRAQAAPNNAGHDLNMIKAKILPRSLLVHRIRQHTQAVLLVLAFFTVSLFVSGRISLQEAACFRNCCCVLITCCFCCPQAGTLHWQVRHSVHVTIPTVISKQQQEIPRHVSVCWVCL